jgi:hypothetical protein
VTQETIDIDRQRAANFADLAVRIRDFAARQEARAPGRMAHITGPALKAADAAERAAAAYAAGDRETARAARAEYAELAGFNGANVGGVN